MFGDGIFGDVIFADLQTLSEEPPPTPIITVPGDGGAMPFHYRNDDDEVAGLLAVIL